VKNPRIKIIPVLAVILMAGLGVVTAAETNAVFLSGALALPKFGRLDQLDCSLHSIPATTNQGLLALSQPVKHYTLQEGKPNSGTIFCLRVVKPNAGTNYVIQMNR
jgi:hypothetical protein